MRLRLFIVLWFSISVFLDAQNEGTYPSGSSTNGYGYSNYYQKGWQFYGNSSINTSQSSFSNWQGGGLSSISIYTSLNLNLFYIGDKTKWESILGIGYGLMLQGNDNEWFKSDDRFDFNTKVGIRASDKWYYTSSLRFMSQFQPGYYDVGDSLPISDFLSPGYITGALGFDFNPSSKLSVILGPITSKNTIVLDQNLANMGAYGVEPGEYDYIEQRYLTQGKNLRTETGGSINISYINPRVVKNVGINTRLFLFSNYLRNPENIDVNFESNIRFQINEFITTSIFIHLIYDDDIQIALDDLGLRRGPRLQFKEVLGVGLNIDLGEVKYNY
ncbi:MAG: DUF3078 domain-containing protein [Bacteroidia bacterium]